MKMKLFYVIVAFCVLSLNKPVFSQVDLYLDHINVYVNTYGKVSLYTLPDTIRQIYQTTVLVGTDSDAVFDYFNDADVEDSTQLLATPTYGDYEIYGSYNNNFTGVPPDILEKQNVYCWQDQNSIIVKYTLINREPSSVDAIVGLELVPEVEGLTTGEDTVTYSSLSNVISVKKSEVVGFKPLSDKFKSLGAFVWYSEYRGDTTYYRWLTYNSFDSLFVTDPSDPNIDDPVLIPAYNTQTIASGDSVIYYIAIAYGINETEMLASMQEAQDKYNLITSVSREDNLIPQDYSLKQNYPNPFNPATKISFSIPQTEYVTIVVYNLLGEAVAELINSEMAPGNYNYSFDGSNLTSGIYFYSLTAGKFSETKKMILMK